MKKITFFFLWGAIALISLASCSKTRDGLGLDTIRNNARTGKWELTRQIYLANASEPVTSENLTAGAGWAEFKSDNKVYIYNSSGVENPASAKTYSFLDTKTILYGGDQFKIQETLAGSFRRMTLQRSTEAGREVYIFQR